MKNISFFACKVFFYFLSLIHQLNGTEMETTKKIIAFTDSVNECDCCGKSRLKGTFCVEINGEEFYYGSSCAFKKHGLDKKEISYHKQQFDTKIEWAVILSGKMFRKHNEENKSFDEIFEIIKPLAFSNNLKAIKNLIPSLIFNV